ncbi:MAG: DUF5615 family PIN-like protein [Opitutaceae bacterium]
MNRVLLDENLPHALAQIMGAGVVHVTELGSRMLDQELWKYGRAHDCIIVTKDADFFDRLVVEGPPPRVVWIRTGNLRRLELEAVIARNVGRNSHAADHRRFG